MAFIRKILLRFVFAFKGITFALRNDQSFRMQFVGGLIFLALFVYITKPLSQIEATMLFLSWTLVLITELQNTSFESALDKIHPELHDKIGRSKDMAAGAVLIAGFFALGIVTMIVLARIV